MDIVDFRAYCLSLPEVEECLPFDDVTLVFKVAGRMFAVVGLDNPIGFVVKCEYICCSRVWSSSLSCISA